MKRSIVFTAALALALSWFATSASADITVGQALFQGLGDNPVATAGGALTATPVVDGYKITALPGILPSAWADRCLWPNGPTTEPAEPPSLPKQMGGFKREARPKVHS